MAWFKPQYATVKGGPKPIEIPSGLWTRCDGCRQLIYNKELVANLKVCPKCKHHFRISGHEWLNILLDEGTYCELDANIKPTDPLGFVDSKKYTDRLRDDQEKTKLTEAIITGRGMMSGIKICIGAMDFSFRGGSMGSVVGEKIARAVETAIEQKLPLVIISASGAARMQEGILSLMQMAKTSAAVAKLGKAHLPFISVLTNPTSGGVLASFAAIGDIIIAEPRAVTGFAGARVIEQTIRQKLPSHFQKAEFLLQHGFVDLISERKDMKETLVRILKSIL